MTTKKIEWDHSSITLTDHDSVLDFRVGLAFKGDKKLPKRRLWIDMIDLRKEGNSIVGGLCLTRGEWNKVKELIDREWQYKESNSLYKKE